MKLTDKEIKNKGRAPSDRTQKLFDGHGLYLEMPPSGGKLWRLKYRFGGKENRLALGKYPEITLAKAREMAAVARGKLAHGVDPAAERREAREKAAEQRAQEKRDELTFDVLVRRWIAENAAKREGKTVAKWEFFAEHAKLHIGDLPAAQIRAADLVKMVRAIDGEGLHETARRAYALAARALRYGVAHGLIQRNPAADVALADFVAPAKVQHYSSITDPKAIGGLLRAVDGYEGSPAVRLALRFAALVFVRPGELRHAEWREFDFAAAAEWRIPGPKMKMGEQHIVPLSRQAIATLEALKPLTGGGRYLFPSERTAERPMSENTVNAALRRLGYSKTEMTGHGFRSMASTRLHELGFNHQVIEAQLAHAERNKVAAAYNFAEYLPERRSMMQAWADHLDALREGAKVIPLVA